MDTVFKVCCGCKKSVLRSDGFYRRSSARDGLQRECKRCMKARDMKWYAEHKEKAKERALEWKTNNIERFREIHRRSCRKWNAENPVACRENGKKWRADNPNRCLELARRQRAERPHKHREASRKRWLRRKSDPQYRISKSLRRRTHDALKGKLKAGSAVRDLGCTSLDLKRHLESQFTTGMSWHNYGIKSGQWSIDHIMPLSAFDLTDRQHFVLASHYCNLQPMWHLDNIAKGGKIVQKLDKVFCEQPELSSISNV